MLVLLLGLWLLLGCDNYENQISGEDFSVSVDSLGTVKTLKDVISKEIGIEPELQNLFCFGFPLQEDDILLEELLPQSRSFNLVLQEEEGEKLFGNRKELCKFVSETAKFLIRGGKTDFQAIYLPPNRTEQIRLNSNKFGIVEHTEGIEPGKRVFHLHRYVAKRDARIELRDEKGKTNAYLVEDSGPNGNLILLKPEEYTTYEESRRNMFASYFSNLRTHFQ